MEQSSVVRTDAEILQSPLSFEHPEQWTGPRCEAVVGTRLCASNNKACRVQGWRGPDIS